MANITGDYCPLLNVGLGLQVTEHLNDRFGVNPNLVLAILRYAHGQDPSCVITGENDLSLEEFMETKGMKDALSEYFGVGESTFLVDTQEEYNYFTDIYDRLRNNNWINDDGVVSVGGLKNINEIVELFSRGAGDDYGINDRVKRWRDKNNNLHASVPRPTLSQNANITNSQESFENNRNETHTDASDTSIKENLETVINENKVGVAEFVGMTPDVFEHNKQAVIELGEKAIQDRNERLEKAQENNEKKSPIEKFRSKFTDKNMLNFLTEVACRRISNIISELQNDDSDRTIAKKYFHNSFTNYDFPRMTRKEIILNPDIFRAIWQNAKYLDFAKTSESEDENLDDILEMIYDDNTDGVENFILLLHNGRDILYRNEGINFEYDGSIQEVDTEDSDNEEQADIDADAQYEDGEGSDYESNDQYKLAEPSVPASRKITQKIKLMLSNIPDVQFVTNKNGEKVLDHPGDPWGFGYNMFVNPGRAVNTILNILSGADTIEEMEERLKSSVDAFPWLNGVLERISNSNNSPLSIDKEKMRNDFFASFRKDKTIFTSTTMSVDSDGLITYKYAEKNRGGNIRKAKQNIYSHYENQEGMPLFKDKRIDFSGTSNTNLLLWARQDLSLRFMTDNRGNVLEGAAWRMLQDMYEEDPEQLYNTIDRGLSNNGSVLNNIYRTLLHLGIDCSKSTFYAIAMSDKNGGIENFAETNIGKIAQNLYSIAFQLQAFRNIPYYNPMDYEQAKENSVIDPNRYIYISPKYDEILRIINAFTESDVESVAHVNGRAHYAFNYPTFMQTTVAKLSNLYGSRKRLNEFFDKRYNNDWYSYVDDDGNRVYYLDILDKISKGQNLGKLEYLQKLDLSGVDYKKMSPRGYAMAILSDYFSQVDQSTAVYRAPIASDKPAMDCIRWIRYSNTTNNSYKDIITDQAWKIALQEINRSRRVLLRALRGEKPIANYDIKLKTKEEKQRFNDILDKMERGENVVFQDLFVNGKYLFAKSGVGFKMMRMMQDLMIDNSKSGNAQLDESAKRLRTAIIDSIFNGKNTIKDLSNDFAYAFEQFMDARLMLNMGYLNSIGVFDKITLKDDDPNQTEFQVYKHFEGLAKEFAIQHKLMPVDQDGNPLPYVPRNQIDDIIEMMLEEFMYNNFIMQIQMTELFGVDLAYYKGTTDFQKRSAQTRSTGQKLNKSATIFGKNVGDGKFRTLTVKSVKHESFQKNEIEDVLNTYSNTIEDDQQRRVFKQEIPNIIAKYNSVDATDGQAWNCISSLRKKHIMAAQWTYEKDDANIPLTLPTDGSKPFLNEKSDTDEAVYRRMKLGLPLPKDFFHVFTQVDKPFVYDVSLRDGVPVPVQQKNSEYTYVLVNQFMSTKRDDSPIAVIINAMERTFEKNPLTGLDTINFDSAVKVGTHDGIDLEQNIGKLRKQLNDVLGIDKDKNVYGDFIDEIDIDSYSYQQSNPEHFIDHWQLIGSQMKILALANTHDDEILDVNDDLSSLKSIYEGDTISGKQLKELYFSVLRNRVLLGDKKLRDELSLNDTFRAKVNAISKQAKSSFALNRKYNADDMRGVSVLKDNFLLAGEDPTQAENLKAVMSSWVKKALYRQPILGGPIVQSTNFGQTKDLKTVIENGIFKYFETIVPMPEQILKLLRDENGNVKEEFFDLKTGVWKFPHIRAYLDKVGAKDMLNILMYRIPTEGKYSIFPCKIVGFVPNGGGSTTWLPQDGTTIAGFDFDIDKMFAIMKEYSVQDGKIVTRHDNGKVISYTPKAKSDYGKLAGYNNVLFDLQWLSLTTMQSASEIFDPGNFDDLTDLSYQIELLRAKNADGTNTYTMQQVMSMDSDQLKNAWEDINDFDVTELQTMIKLQNQNMSTKDMLGIAAVANISHAQISMFTSDTADPANNKYVLKQRMPSHSVITVQWKDRRGNVRTRELTESVQMDRLLDWNGELISKYLRKYIGAAADGAKNPTLPRLGVDKVTFPVIQWLLRAGCPMNVAHLYTSLPVFNELSMKYQSMNNDEKTSVDRAINELEFDIFNSNRNLFNGYRNAAEYRKAKYKDAKGNDNPIYITLSDDELLGAIYNPSLVNDPMAKFHLLEQFRYLSNLSNTWTTFSDYGRINSSVAGPKPSIEENQNRANKVNDIMDLFKNEFIVGMSYEDLQRAMPYETQMRDSVTELLSAIQDDFFPSYQSDTYRYAMDIVESVAGKRLSADIKERFNQAQKIMALSRSGYELGGPDFIQLYNPEDAKKFFINFANYYQSELKELRNANENLKSVLDKNLLIKLIGEPVYKTPSCPIDLLNTEIFGADEDYKYKITLSWLELMEYNNPDIDKEVNQRVHSLAFDLFRYFTLRNGGKGFSAKTPWHLAPLDLKMAIPGYNDRLKKISSFTTDDFRFALQFLLNNARDKNLVTQIDNSVFHEDLFTAPSGEIEITEDLAINLISKNEYWNKSDGEDLLKPIFYLGDNIVLLLGDKNDFINGGIYMDDIESLTYHIVPAMGIPNVMSEYYPYLRNSSYGYYSDKTGEYKEPQDISTLTDFEERRQDGIRSSGININRGIEEILQDEFGYKLSDVIDIQDYNMSVSRVRVKNYLKLSDKALLQRLGFKKTSEFNSDIERGYRFLQKAKQFLKDVC